MEFTGERLVPGTEGYEDLFLEHVSRYMFASRFVQGKTVLDAGCGSGYGSYHLARSGAKSVLGVDCSAEAIDYCREHFRDGRLSFQTGNVSNTGLEAGSFDAVVAFEVFEHLEDPGAFLEEMGRLLKPDGVFVLSTPNANTYAAGGKDGTNPYHVQEYTPEEFAGLLGVHFPRIAFFAQSPWNGLGIFPVHGDPVATFLDASLRLVLPSGDSAWGEPVPATARSDSCAYVVAVCRRSNRGTLITPPASLFATGRDLSRRREPDPAAVRRIRDLESELDGRARWVEKLKQDLAERDETIRRLQEEFEDRSQWALELDRTVQAQAKLIAALQRQRVDAT